MVCHHDLVISKVLLHTMDAEQRQVAANLLYMEHVLNTFYNRPTGWLGSVVVGHRTGDREVASSTPGRCVAG